jgi:octaprenyl-diphosphate synthase
VFPIIEKELKLLEKNLKEILCSDSPLIYQISQHILDKRGKRLRPILVFLSAGGCGNSNDEKNTLKAACAIELLHTATLLHDDVVDQSESRRGQETINHRWNNLVAVLMGDYLFAKAFKLMVEIDSLPLMNAISQATERVSTGELLQVQECFNFQIDEPAYLKIISEKTASLFSVSCEAGAIVAGVKNSLQEKLKNFGENLGISFQIADDLLDLVGDKKKTGKEVGNDLKEGKVTLPLIYTLQHSDKATKKRMLSILENDFTLSDFKKIQEIIKGNGGLQYAKFKAEEFGKKALSFLSALKESEYKESLRRLVEFARERER